MSVSQWKKYVPFFIAGGLTIFAASRALILFVKSWSQKRVRLVKEEDVILLITSPAEWDQIYPRLMKACSILKVVGLDCEWVPATHHEQRRPVALLQIAAPSGLCVLVRLCKFSEEIPSTLKSFLSDKSILKTGVAVNEDGHKLFKDYNLVLKGGIDLRHVLNRVRGIFKITSPGLKGLCKGVLQVTLEKPHSIRCGNWEIDELLPQQIKYAAMDAIVGLDIFIHLVVAKVTGMPPTQKTLQNVLRDEGFMSGVLSVCQGISDIPYSMKNDSFLDSTVVCQNGSKRRCKPLEVGELSSAVRSYSTRRSPLYHNCKLQAPDGQLLCTCDEKKAYWYIEKKLGEKICDDPMTVRLFFEPSGRPDSSRNYYLQDKDNVCVVCGGSEQYIRKIVVPHEYRKYFPFIMKEHSSHDVLLLCPTCHARSSQYDSILRQQLADRCGAPLDSGTGTKMRQDCELHKVKSAAKALKSNNSKLPSERRQLLEHVIKTHFGVLELTDDLLDKALEIDTRIYNSSYMPHGLKVVEYVRQNEGLVSFERMWRQHFLDTMKPQFLPLYWSVDHNHERLAQFDDFDF